MPFPKLHIIYLLKRIASPPYLDGLPSADKFAIDTKVGKAKPDYFTFLPGDSLGGRVVCKIA